MKGIGKAAVNSALTAALVAGALVGGAAPASAAWSSCNLSAKVNELRSWDTNNKYNIIVWKRSAYGSANLNGVVVTGRTERKVCGFNNDVDFYSWAVFKSGTFVRQGDGGYRNWAFFGKFKRESDKRVVFKPR